ncbi:hypothetical protein Rleg10DRAFT_7022 [Rhizobium leguminosarum bv. trifolii WSM2012]|nr:hypothetical protein Rleg10DRAFT_7022 [Rhizobium leguminosarum bv. trifolii WSM2012]
METHFREIDFGEDELSAKGLTLLNVSIFSHWLSEEEASESALMSYALACSAGKLDDYLKGEKKFLDLYQSLSGQGVICNRPGPLRQFDIVDEELTQIFIDSLREHRSMDVFFVSCKARFVGRYDRTDLIILEDAGSLGDLQEEVGRSGLFILL